jgi:hypothetical protein
MAGGAWLRRIGDPVVAAAPAGVRIRTKIRVSQTEAAALTANQHWRRPLQQRTSEPVTGHHAAAAAIGRRGLGLAIRRRPAGPATDSGPLRAHHRPGPTTNRAPHTAGAAVLAHPHPHDGYGSTRKHPPPAANTVRAAPKQGLTPAH